MADLGCGIGADSLQFARAGLEVLAVEADPATAASPPPTSAGTGAIVETRDATTMSLSDVDTVFCDPARRDAARGRRVFDPAAFSPPWTFVTALADRVARTVLKLAPGIDHALIPPGAEAEWVSVDGDVVEAAVWCGPLAEHPRRATVLRGDGAAVLTGSGVEQAPVGPLGRYLYDPDGAVVRSHLVAEFAATIDGTLADPRIAYVFTDEAVTTPFGPGFELLDQLPYGVKPLRAELRGRGIGAAGDPQTRRGGRAGPAAPRAPPGRAGRGGPGADPRRGPADRPARPARGAPAPPNRVACQPWQDRARRRPRCWPGSG